jgi:signal transduction histidine kinase
VKNDLVALAQELHDGIAQDLVGLGFSIDNAISHSNSPETRTELRTIRFEISELIEKVRVEIHRLRTLPSYPVESNASLAFELNRIFNEVIRNVERHSRASSLSISITDNGIGGASIKDGSFGLVGIRERVKSLHGETLIESDQNGTRIDINIPLDKNDTSFSN